MKAKINLTILFLLTFALNSPAEETLTLKGNQAEQKATAPFAVTVTGAGRPMILIPGLGCGGNVWDGAVAHFKDTYQCHIVTLAGFAGQPAIGAPFLKQVRDGLSKYIRDTKLERPVIVGHSLGGFLAFWLAADMPDQTGPLIAVDGLPYYPALMDAKTTPQLQQPMAEWLRNGFKMQTPAQFVFNNKLTLAGMITNPKDVEKVAELSNRSDPQAVGQAIYEIMTTDLREKVKSIRSPVLLIAATSPTASTDEKKREEESYLAQVATIPKHKVVFAQKSQHFIQLDEPTFFIQEAEAFLKEANRAKDE